MCIYTCAYCVYYVKKKSCSTSGAERRADKNRTDGARRLWGRRAVSVYCEQRNFFRPRAMFSFFLFRFRKVRYARAATLPPSFSPTRHSSDAVNRTAAARPHTLTSVTFRPIYSIIYGFGNSYSLVNGFFNYYIRLAISILRRFFFPPDFRLPLGRRISTCLRDASRDRLYVQNRSV